MTQQGANDPFEVHQKPTAFSSGWRQPKQTPQTGTGWAGGGGSYKPMKKKKKDPNQLLWMMGIGVGAFFCSSMTFMIFWELYKPIPVYLSFFMLAGVTYYDPSKLMKNVHHQITTMPHTDYLLPSLTGENAMQAMHVWLRIVTCWLGVLLGAVCGMNAEEKFMSHCFAISFGREYTDVLANAHGAAYTDAGSVTFGSSSDVDTVQSVGFKSGYTYCAAPILDTNQGHKSVAFWAVGYDCCSARGNFDCGNAASNNRKGARAPPDGVFYKDTGMFMRAVEQASHVYNLDLDDEVVLLHWVENPGTRKVGKFFTAAGAVLCGTVLFALLAFVLNLVGLFAEHEYTMDSSHDTWQQDVLS